MDTITVTGETYGEIVLDGKVYEPTTHHQFIVPGDEVEVERLTPEVIRVRPVRGGGAEIWRV